MCWGGGDVDGDDECGESELPVESGRGDDGVNHGDAGSDDGVFGESHRWHHGMFQQREWNGECESVADGECEFGDSLCGRSGDVDGDDECDESELPVESGGGDDGGDHGDAGSDDGVYGEGDGRGDGMFQ